MAVLAKSTKSMTIIGADKSDGFIKNFNKKSPSKEFIDSCKKAGELFNRKK